LQPKRTASQSEKFDNTGSQGGWRRVSRIRRADSRELPRRKQMKITLLALVAASALSLSLASHASAAPAGGAAIARIGQQVDPAINVAAKKKKNTQTAAKSCPAGQEMSGRTGKCRPPTSEEK
jgi:hypothetical protein